MTGFTALETGPAWNFGRRDAQTANRLVRTASESQLRRRATFPQSRNIVTGRTVTDTKGQNSGSEPAAGAGSGRARRRFRDKQPKGCLEPEPPAGT